MLNLKDEGVAVAIDGTHGHVLDRNLLYTAMTRAKQRLVIVGSKQALCAAIGNAKGQVRLTGLKNRLSEAAAEL